MSCRTWLTFICLLMIIASAEGLCHWDVEVTPAPGMERCRGNYDSRQNPWPRLPTDAEIETAKEDYLAFLMEGDDQRRIDGVNVAKFHTCEGSWVNRVEMQVDWSWWWSSIAAEPGEGEWKPAISYTFLVYSPGSDEFEFVATTIPSVYFLGMSGDTVQGFATGSCSGGGTTGSSGGSSPPESDDGLPWVVIVGALAVLGAAGFAGAKLLGGKKKTAAAGKPEEKKKKKEQEKVRYILQLSTDRLTVTADATAHLTVTAWKIIGDTPSAPAPEAAITLTIPPEDRGLSVQPPSGQGTVEASVSLVSQVSRNPVTITVTASAGKSSISSTVTVEIPADYVMEFF
jgi:hypothetical protein